VATEDDIFEEAGPDSKWSEDETDDDLEELEVPVVVDLDDDAEVDDKEEGGDGEADEALDELEAEELEMLTEDEEAEALPIDEAAEFRKIRLEAIALDAGAEEAGRDEFVCGNCFQIKRVSQLANKRKRLCRDCS